MTRALSFFVELIATEGLLKNENAVANTKINSCRLVLHGKWESSYSKAAPITVYEPWSKTAAF